MTSGIGCQFIAIGSCWFRIACKPTMPIPGLGTRSDSAAPHTRGPICVLRVECPNLGKSMNSGTTGPHHRPPSPTRTKIREREKRHTTGREEHIEISPDASWGSIWPSETCRQEVPGSDAVHLDRDAALS